MFDVVIRSLDHDAFKLNDDECVIEDEFNHVRIESCQEFVKNLALFV